MHPSVAEILVMSVAVLVRLLLPSLILVFLGYALAKDKGRPVVKWTIISFIPIVNCIGLIFLIGCTNLRLERKIDALLAGQNAGADPRIEPRFDWQ